MSGAGAWALRRRSGGWVGSVPVIRPLQPLCGAGLVGPRWVRGAVRNGHLIHRHGPFGEMAAAGVSEAGVRLLARWVATPAPPGRPALRAERHLSARPAFEDEAVQADRGFGGGAPGGSGRVGAEGARDGCDGPHRPWGRKGPGRGVVGAWGGPGT
ncbi:hypothetical protein GCM10023335_24150 [Streptomyces siamensis]|uniref:Uncharacterized protein n=1 Tax=Streptomyces siamensis TaxID=1274986 RepID=A0ABP9IQS3_9ACTN